MAQERETTPLETLEKVEPPKKEEKPENNLTISTKLSTEQLICASSQESPIPSVKSFNNKNEPVDDNNNNKVENADVMFTSLLYLGTMQILFGFLMATFGVLAIVHNARLAQLGGGLWGGCLAVASGTAGVLAAAKNFCPLKDSAQKVAHTVFLALSLICVAISQLVLVLAATGLARDINHSEFMNENNEVEITTTPKSDEEEVFPHLPPNYMALLANTGLLIVSGIQCICAAISSYHSSRSLCPCFRDRSEMSANGLQIDTKDAFVHSWLGKHTLPSPLYVVASPTNTGKRNKYSNALAIAPVLPLPPPVLQPPPPPQVMGYPLIPAPLGPIPSPMIRPHPKEMASRRHRRRHSADHHCIKKLLSQEKPRKYKSKSKSKSKERPVTTEEVIRTYTGLDRAIAEEFIEICDSRNTSICSDSSCSCQSSSCGNSCQNGCTATACTSLCNTGSDDMSKRRKL